VLTKTRAFVLKEIKFRDTSTICTLYTREFGRLSVILKGGRNPKSKLSGLFSTGNLLEVVLYKGNNRNLHLVSEARIIRSPMTAEPDMERFSAIYRIIETIRNTTGNEEKNIRLFDALARTIVSLCNTCQNTDAVVAWFLLRLISNMGFEPSIEHCVMTGDRIMATLEKRPDSVLYLFYDPGGVALEPPTIHLRQAGQPLPIPVYLLMHALANTDILSVSDLDVLPEESQQLCDILQNYCSMHSDNQPPVKSRKIISQIRSKEN
jgi:DNA repair protein RecO (recombination protein O)